MIDRTWKTFNGKTPETAIGKVLFSFALLSAAFWFAVSLVLVVSMFVSFPWHLLGRW